MRVVGMVLAVGVAVMYPSTAKADPIRVQASVGTTLSAPITTTSSTDQNAPVTTAQRDEEVGVDAAADASFRPPPVAKAGAVAAPESQPASARARAIAASRSPIAGAALALVAGLVAGDAAVGAHGATGTSRCRSAFP